MANIKIYKSYRVFVLSLTVNDITFVVFDHETVGQGHTTISAMASFDGKYKNV